MPKSFLLLLIRDMNGKRSKHSKICLFKQNDNEIKRVLKKLKKCLLENWKICFQLWPKWQFLITTMQLLLRAIQYSSIGVVLKTGEKSHYLFGNFYQLSLPECRNHNLRLTIRNVDSFGDSWPCEGEDVEGGEVRLQELVLLEVSRPRK